MASLTKFFNDGGVWYLGNNEAVTVGFYNRRIDAKGIVYITNTSNGTITSTGHWSTFCDVNGTAYASAAAFRTATNGFFKAGTVSIDSVTPISIISKDSAGVESQEKIITVKSTITLPANTNAYAAGDVVANATISKFLNVAKAAGRGVVLIGSRIQVTEASLLGGKTFNIHLYNDTVAAIADNAPFAIADVNTDKREGYIAVIMGTGNRVKVGHNNVDQIALVPIGVDVPFLLETVEGWTPAANSGIINIYTKWLIQ